VVLLVGCLARYIRLDTGIFSRMKYIIILFFFNQPNINRQETEYIIQTYQGIFIYNTILAIWDLIKAAFF
jgi:hypothetical protein